VAALLALAIQRLDVARVAREMARARPGWIAIAFVSYLSILPLWALQWWLLAPPGPRRTPARLLRVVSMTSSVLNTAPMLAGEVAGVHFLSEVAGVARSSGLAVLAMDQLLVGLAKLIILSAAAATLPLPRTILGGVRALVVAVMLLFVTLMVLARRGERLRQALAHRVPARVADVVERAIRALTPLRSPVHGGGAFAIAILKKCCELLAILAIQHAFGIVLPASSALVVLAALNLATLLPLVPGNAGVFEAVVVVAYGWLGVSPEQALGMAVVQHAVYFVALALPGYAWLARTLPSRSIAAAR
jgi:uncharacterized protein (TIRG00374 family)